MLIVKIKIKTKILYTRIIIILNMEQQKSVKCGAKKRINLEIRTFLTKINLVWTLTEIKVPCKVFSFFIKNLVVLIYTMMKLLIWSKLQSNNF